MVKLGGAVLFFSAFVLLDGLVRKLLYQGEPDNPNFRLPYAIDRFRGKWELRAVAVSIPVGILLLVIGKLT